MRWLTAALLMGAAAAGYALVAGWVALPEAANPWAALNVASNPNFLTSLKLARARSDAGLCMDALQRSGAGYSPIPDRTAGAGCGLHGAVTLRSAGTARLLPPAPLSCPMALSLAMWERHTLQPASMALFGIPARSIEHLGSYACRNINTGEGDAGGASERRSRHASADALDIASVTLPGGRRLSVLESGGKDAATGPDARFMQALHDGACRWFQGTLGPGYNAAHRNHFHVETGGFSGCL
jgi:hypothetical protein